MATHSSFAHQNIFIPPGSHVAATVAGNSNLVRVTAHMSGPGFPPGFHAEHPAAFNNVFRQPLAQDGTYTLIIDVDFFGEANVQSEMQVFTPQGGPFSPPWVVQLKGDIGDTATLVFTLGVLAI